MGSARGLECGRVVDCAWTVEPAKPVPVTVPGVDLGECVNPAELGEPAPLVEAGMVAATPHYGRLEVFPCDGTLLDLLGLLDPPLLLCACEALLKNTLKLRK